MLHVVFLLKLRPVGRLQCLALNLFPVDHVKPGVVFDVFSIGLATAQTLLRIFFQQHGTKVSGLRRKELVVHLWLAILNILVELIPVFAVEGRKANKHLVDNGAEGPPVGGFAVALTLQNFR